MSDESAGKGRTGQGKRPRKGLRVPVDAEEPELPPMSTETALLVRPDAPHARSFEGDLDHATRPRVPAPGPIPVDTVPGLPFVPEERADDATVPDIQLPGFGDRIVAAPESASVRETSDEFSVDVDVDASASGEVQTPQAGAREAPPLPAIPKELRPSMPDAAVLHRAVAHAARGTSQPGLSIHTAVTSIDVDVTFDPGAEEAKALTPEPLVVLVPPTVPPGAGAPVEGRPSEVKVAPPPVPTAVKAAREGSQPKPRPKPWYETFFDTDYISTVKQPTPAQVGRQCDFIERALGLNKGARILDVGCGIGLQAAEFASRGYDVTALDMSKRLLARATDEAKDRGVAVRFVQADMREMQFQASFDALLCIGSTYGYFDDESNRQVLERFHQALKPMGLLFLDIANRDYAMRQQPNLIWFEGNGCVCMDETVFNYIGSRLEVRRTLILDDGTQREHKYSVRMYSVHELGRWLNDLGFRVTEVSGSECTPGVFFGSDSARLLCLAERRHTPKTAPPPTRDSKLVAAVVPDDDAPTQTER